MKTFILSIIVTMITSVAGAQQKSFYDFTVKTIDGKDLPLSTFKGKKVLVVNVASKCGFTPQYAKLEELYEKYGKDDFVVIGFPANNFLHQAIPTARGSMTAAFYPLQVSTPKSRSESIRSTP